MQLQARRFGRRPGVHRAKIDIVDRALAVQVDEVDERATDAFDARNVQLHRTCALRSGLGAEAQCARVRPGGIAHAKRHGAGGRAVRPGERLGEGLGFGVDDEVDLALAVQRHVLRAMARDHRKAEPLEQRAQQLRIRRGVLDELEAIGTHGVVRRVGHELTYSRPGGGGCAAAGGRSRPAACGPRAGGTPPAACIIARRATAGFCGRAVTAQDAPRARDTAAFPTRMIVHARASCC